MKWLWALPLALAATPAMAHAGNAGESIWTFDASITLPLALVALAFAIGTARLWRRAGFGHGVKTWQAICFAAGCLLLVVALVSPLHWLGEQLFSAHMLEHEVLMALAPPLLVLARPGIAMLWSLPLSARRGLGAVSGGLSGLWRILTEPWVATALHALALWAWHAPALYDAALENEGLHWLEHFCFLGTALPFWWALFAGRAYRQGFGAAIFYLFITASHSAFLGILIALAKQPLYPVQTEAAARWGLAPMADQQLAGLIMWVPGGMVYAVAALALAGLWIVRSGRAVANPVR
ncbi:MAG TPA: cytochrome c oxidase assembly protein [Arsenicitalea sp.]|nr:cytochrome c oxidase assembly protein [Arsenicitalea sp.]